MDTVMADPDFSDGMPVPVRAPDGRDETIRINLTIRRSALASIDRNAAMHVLSRSAYLAKVGTGSS
ncbi:type II toxin-antitoxin system HicB family antitoxin [Thalassobaculum litoreum]|nr:type II toxin-antitoxin system HicB family antitoxin [Thalassobaculum litoreum]